MEHDKTIAEGRARIIWGESASSVRDFLVANGMANTIADARIKEFILERNTEIRRIGVRNTIVGAILVVAGGSVLYWICTWILPAGSARVYGLGGRGIITGVVALSAIVMYGLWKLVNGIICLVRPQSEHRSISDFP